MNFKDSVNFFLNSNRINEEKCSSSCETKETKASVDSKEGCSSKIKGAVENFVNDCLNNYNINDPEKIVELVKKAVSKSLGASVHTKTAGGDDDDDGYRADAAVNTEDKETIQKLIKDGVLKVDTKRFAGLAGDLTPEEKQMLAMFGIKSAVVDNHANGRNGSVETDEEGEASVKSKDCCPKCGKNPCECKKTLKEAILNLA